MFVLLHDELAAWWCAGLRHGGSEENAEEEVGCGKNDLSNDGVVINVWSHEAERYKEWTNCWYRGNESESNIQTCAENEVKVVCANNDKTRIIIYTLQATYA